MLKRLVPVSVLIALMAAPVAHAQYGGGGGGGHRHGGGGGQASQGDDNPAPRKDPTAANPAAIPMSEVEIIGVVQAIDPKADRVTIAYDPVQALNWPAGSLPFVVARSALLQGVSVGEKVRFKLDSQQISALRPF
jgi:Cu/Ag efflux protein CusF